MSEELKQAISALQCAKRGHCDHAMADEAIAALEALTQRPAAQTEREAFESRVTLNSIIKQYRIKAEDAHWLRASLPTQPAAQATPDQFADASKMVAPVALRSVHLTRDTAGMCVVRINGRVAIRDNGDLIDHTATLEWFADTQQATPEPVGEVPIWNSIQIASWIGSQLMHEPAMFERAAVCKFVRSLGRHPTLLKHSPKDHVPAPGVPEGWRDAFDLAAQMLTWGRDEGLTPEQVNEVDAHAKLMFAMLAAQAKGADK